MTQSALSNKIVRHFGWTLPELLIALVILGVISTFAISSIVSQSQQRTLISKFKETYATFSEILYEGYVNRSIQNGEGMLNALVSKLNYVRYCPNNSLTEGCWSTEMGEPAEATYPGFVLSNGVHIAGVDGDPGSLVEYIQLDLNGPEGPNTEGQDHFALVLCLNTHPNCDAWVWGTYTGKRGPGTVAPGNNPELYNQYMQ